MPAAVAATDFESMGLRPDAARALSDRVNASLRRHPNRLDADEQVRLWLDFRDSFGLLWSLRVQQRLNELATQNGWDHHLTWRGFQQRSTGQPLTQIDPSIEPTLRTSLKGLLRRFVSNHWIECRSRLPDAT